MSDTGSTRARFRFRSFAPRASTVARAGPFCFAVGVVVMGPACDDHLVGVAAPINLGCTRDPPLTYDNFGKGILQRHCNGCHSDFMRAGQRGDAPLDVNLNKWEYVLDWADRIEVRAVEDVDMPPTGTMVPLERQLLGEWLKCDVLPQIGEVQLTTTGGGSS